MISVSIWDEAGGEYQAPSLSPKQIKEFVDLIKEFGVWINGNQYSFKEAMYHAENKSFDITVE